ncbi:MAG: MBOAT family protein, partial [Spirochaetia bacterium]|nr:MBOAT family protein [Spirochaetia bacterium]
AVYLIYWILSGKPRQHFLLLASLVFYAAWGLDREGWTGLRWTLHFVAVILANYGLVTGMHRRPHLKGRLLTALIVLDVANLAVFKYFGFFRDALSAVGVPLPDAVLATNLFLPLAISFYTFQLVAYAADVYRGVITEEAGPFRFLLFILFFPHQIAGPIMRSTDFIPQLDHPFLSRRRMFDGSWLILSGLFKKVLLADPMSYVLAPVFREPQTYNGWSIAIAGMCFSLQVYCDFSGYTDIARGCALYLGYDIPENFRAPFFSKSARELWQRWHITLATWLRDYIYFPLGGNRKGELRTYINLFITFTLGGFWHGADFTYIAWGAMWGGLLAVERFVEDRLGIKTTPEKNRPMIVLKIFFMFCMFSVGALFFRTQKVVYEDRVYSSGHMLVEVFGGMVKNAPADARVQFIKAGGSPALPESVFGPDVFTLNDVGQYGTIVYMFALLVLFHFFQYRPGMFERWRKYDAYLLLGAGAVMGGILLPWIAIASHQFIYFVF